MNAFERPELFKCDFVNPWKDTPLEDYYCVQPKIKGVQGEKIAETILKELGYDIKPATSSGNDRLVNGVKTEIKFSAASERNYDWKFTFNHIGFKKDWEDIIFVGVNGDLNIHITKYNKNSFPKEFVSRQQGGKSGDNDDFMSTGAKSQKIMMGGECLLNGMEGK